MKIGIIDADLADWGTRHPNLALMKISGYEKSKGNSVELLFNYDDIDDYDHVYVSKVFNYTEHPEWIESCGNISIGGTGFYPDGGDNLPDEIEHFMPDYSLYDKHVERQLASGKSKASVGDYTDFSIGFLTRGCFRKCPFCVNRKYDKAFKHSPLEEFYDPDRKRIYLWDDNFLAYSGWEEELDALEETGKYFKFRQGLDLRLMTEAKAKRLSSMKYYGDYIFAFDNIEERDIIERNLKMWNKYCTKTTKLYVLCGFDREGKYDDQFWLQDIKDTFERIKVLMQHQVIPYIMRYDGYEKSPYRGMYVTLARWCNQPSMFKKTSIREFAWTNQILKSDMLCAPVRYVQEFEAEFPDIAEEYFDIKFEDYGDK